MKLDNSCIYKLAIERIDSEIEQSKKEINDLRCTIEDINAEMLQMRLSGKKSSHEYEDLLSKRRHCTYVLNKTMRKLKKIVNDVTIYKLEKRKIDLME